MADGIGQNSCTLPAKIPLQVKLRKLCYSKNFALNSNSQLKNIYARYASGKLRRAALHGVRRTV